MNEPAMTDVKRRLFDAFREDHARLGAALHALGTRLRARDARGARAIAEELDVEAGAHVAFEEHDFYPALAPFLSEAEVDAMYAEHADSRSLIVRLRTLDESALADTERHEALLGRVQAMERHVSECGELFGAMGGLDDAAQRDLLERLDGWRRRAPRWSELAPRATREAP